MANIWGKQSGGEMGIDVLTKMRQDAAGSLRKM